MSIKEKDLPVAESLNKGDKLRVVTADGASKSIDSGAIGGSGDLIIVDAKQTSTSQAYDNPATCNHTPEEIYNNYYPSDSSKKNRLVVCFNNKYYNNTSIEAGGSQAGTFITINFSYIGSEWDGSKVKIIAYTLKGNIDTNVWTITSKSSSLS